jgi:hypothetical protein
MRREDASMLRDLWENYRAYMRSEQSRRIHWAYYKIMAPAFLVLCVLAVVWRNWLLLPFVGGLASIACWELFRYRPPGWRPTFRGHHWTTWVFWINAPAAVALGVLLAAATRG